MFESPGQPQKRRSLLAWVVHSWVHSLRFRLLWLGLMPLLLALPVVLVSVGLIGSVQVNRLIEGQLNSNLSGAQNYLRVFRTDLQSRILDFVQSERFSRLAQKQTPRRVIDETLLASVRKSGFDFLLLVDEDGFVVGSSGFDEAKLRRQLPQSFVIRQAQVGVASSGFEQFTQTELEAFSTGIAKRFSDLAVSGKARGVQPADKAASDQAKATLVLAAAHFPLSASSEDFVLVGGTLLNENSVLIEHLREIIYPTGKLPDQSEGFVGIFDQQTNIVSSRLKSGQILSPKLDGNLIPVETNSGQFASTIGRQSFGEDTFALAVTTMQSGNERDLVFLAVGFPVRPFQQTAWLMLGILAASLGGVMLVVSLIYLNAGRDIVAQLKKIADAMNLFRDGDRIVQIQEIKSKDELGLLGARVNELFRVVAEQELKLERLALHDALTGLANRQNFSQRLTHAMAIGDRQSTYGAVIMIDLDNFKPLNDTYGHSAGDQLLIEVGRRLKSIVREIDTVSRFGGDEFVVLLESLSEDMDAASTRAVQVSEKIRDAMQVPFVIQNRSAVGDANISHQCTSSIGVTLFLGSKLSQDQVLHLADAAMYAAKAGGKNRVSLHQE